MPGLARRKPLLGPRTSARGRKARPVRRTRLRAKEAGVFAGRKMAMLGLQMASLLGPPCMAMEKQPLGPLYKQILDPVNGLLGLDFGP